MENATRERCYQCFRPISLCFCGDIPRIDNRTSVLILQHIGEHSHPFNTARIVQKALCNCQLITDHNQRLGAHRLPLQADAGLLYPASDAPLLTELPASQRPRQLAIIDGTWHQAKTIFRDVNQLHRLPCYRLSPSSPGQYRIRREPNDTSLSTLEATVAALQALEPDTLGLDQLLSAFNRMVEDQLEYPVTQAAWRQKKPHASRPRDMPHGLLQNPESLVVAYGEATPSETGNRAVERLPVSWFARRLGGAAEHFSCLLKQPRPLSKVSLDHFRLSAADFDKALSLDEFCRQWKCFLRRNDTLIVYHNRTYQLLKTSRAAQPRCLVLKSIFGKRKAVGSRSLEDLLSSNGLIVPQPLDSDCRAAQRLEMAVALVEHCISFAS